MIGRGHSIPQIAEKLFRSQKTIETHRQSLGRKLGVSNQVELARIAIQTGLSPLAPVSLAATHSADDPRHIFRDDPVAATAMSRIESACALVVGDAYCRVLVQKLREEIDVAGVVLVSRDGEYKAYRCVTGIYHDEWLPPALPASMTPICNQIWESGFFCRETDLPSQFSEEPALQPRPIHSLMGVRLEAGQDQLGGGVLMVFQDQPIEFVDHAESLLRVSAVRAAGELGQIRLIESLRKRVERLEEKQPDSEAQ